MTTTENDAVQVGSVAHLACPIGGFLSQSLALRAALCGIGAVWDTFRVEASRESLTDGMSGLENDIGGPVPGKDRAEYNANQKLQGQYKYNHVFHIVNKCAE